MEQNVKTGEDFLMTGEPHNRDKLRIQQIDDEQNLDYEPTGKDRNSLETKHTDIEQAKGYIISAFNNANEGFEGSAVGNLYNAILYLTRHCTLNDRELEMI